MDIYSSVVHVVVDIETLSIQDANLKMAYRERLEKTVQAPGNYKKPEAIAAYIANKVDEKMEKTALSANFAEIACISVWDSSSQTTTTFSRRLDNQPNSPVDNTDRRLLADFWSWVEELYAKAPTVIWCGKGVKRFDFPIIRTRSIVNTLKADQQKLHFKKYDTDSVIDLEDDYWWPGSTSGSYTSLADIAMVLGIEFDSDYTGANVEESFLLGQWDAIEGHCEEDVLLVVEILKAIGAFNVH